MLSPLCITGCERAASLCATSQTGLLAAKTEFSGADFAADDVIPWPSGRCPVISGRRGSGRDRPRAEQDRKVAESPPACRMSCILSHSLHTSIILVHRLAPVSSETPHTITSTWLSGSQNSQLPGSQNPKNSHLSGCQGLKTHSSRSIQGFPDVKAFKLTAPRVPGPKNSRLSGSQCLKTHGFPTLRASKLTPPGCSHAAAV